MNIPSNKKKRNKMAEEALAAVGLKGYENRKPRCSSVASSTTPNKDTSETRKNRWLINTC